MRIVITGHSSGIGKMVFERMENRGHSVIGLSRSGQFPCDVTNYEHVEDCARYVLDAYDGADALICCAGTLGEPGKLMKSDPLKWNETIQTNLIGSYNAIRAFYPMMDQARRAKIICFAGGGASNGRAYFSAYSTSKTGLVRLVETISQEELGLDINIIGPGTIKTNMVRIPVQLGPEVIGQEEYDKALKQCEEEDNSQGAMDLVDWLLSSESDGISGRFISAKWDDWKNISASKIKGTDRYQLRRITA